MSPLLSRLRRNSGPRPLSPQGRSSRRVAVAMVTVLVTAGILTLVAIQARRAKRALDAAASQTLRNYTGYAGRLMGGDVLRRFADQRSLILAPVTGSAGRAVAQPALEEIVRSGERHFAEFGPQRDPGRGYFRLDLRTGRNERRDGINENFVSRIGDTLRVLVAANREMSGTDLIVLEHDGRTHTVAFAPLLDARREPIAVYGYTYTRALAVAAIAERVFADTPLLPTSFAGFRWNYDTARVNTREVANDSLLVMRITDREGRVLWQSRGVATAISYSFRERAVLRTAAGGIVVESALRPAGEPLLIPAIVRRSQNSSLAAIVSLTILLALVSLHALRRESAGAVARRAEAMQQLALGLRHELNNALASVMLNTELLREEASLDDSQRERLDAIIEQADRMRGVLRHLQQSHRLDVVVPYLDEGYMVDLSGPHRDRRSDGAT